MLSVERARKWVGVGAFFCGLGVIVAACLLNIMYDRLAGSASFPSLLANMYATSGKTGVTVTIVCVGLSIMMLGLAIPRGHRDPASRRRKFGPYVVPLYTPPDSSEREPEVTPDGRVILRTQKYLTPQPAVPGLAPSKQG